MQTFCRKKTIIRNTSVYALAFPALAFTTPNVFAMSFHRFYYEFARKLLVISLFLYPHSTLFII